MNKDENKNVRENVIEISETRIKELFPEYSKKKSKVLNLICRLDKYKASVCLFTKNFFVPFDNNQAERNLRMIKIKMKVSGCFRNENGAKEYLNIMSYVRNAKKHGVNAFTAIQVAIAQSRRTTV